MRRRVHSSKRAAQNASMNDMVAVAKAFTGFRPSTTSSIRVRAVPTIFVQYDHGVRVGGHPTERIALVHGPSGEGKTYFTLGEAKSFLLQNNPVLFVDAERTLEAGFVRLAFGKEVYAAHGYDDPRERPESSLWWWDKPDTYEDTRVQVRDFCNRCKRAREKHPNLSGLIIIDSIRKLVPADQWKKILELAKSTKEEKARDRGAQIKAMMNAAWCDELIPLLEQTGCTMIIIARESDDPNADAKAKLYGAGYITGGGKALYYDASLDIRVQRAKYVTKDQGEGNRPLVYGERHRITIHKSKVAGKEDKTTICYFHTSNGKLVPEGFDRARDVVDLARQFDIVRAPGAKKKAKKDGKKAGGGWLSWNGHRWQGEHAAVKKLSEQPDVLDALEREVRSKFKSHKPIEIDGETGEVL